MIKIIVLLTILITACVIPEYEHIEEIDSRPKTDISLDLYMNTEYNEETEYYTVDYPSANESSYIAVYYTTNPMTRVFWSSEDTYTFIYWGREMTYPIINYSTYSNSYGEGQELIYLYQDHIGDTLSVDGCIETTCQRLYFIVKGTPTNSS